MYPYHWPMYYPMYTLLTRLAYVIWGYFDETTTVADFIANLIPAPGASVKVTDADGVENTGTLAMG